MVYELRYICIQNLNQVEPDCIINLEVVKQQKKTKFPIFIIIISLIEIFVFILNEFNSNEYNSILIYNPERRHEIWRYFSYMLLHVNSLHLYFNVISQLIIGIMLEIHHGFRRIFLVYLFGVLAASLGTSIFQPNVYLIGASGGVYSLIALSLANFLLNLEHVNYWLLKLIVFVICVFVNFAYSIYYNNFHNDFSMPRISIVGHLSSFIIGFMISILILKTKTYFKNLFWWFAFGFILGIIVFVILIHLILYDVVIFHQKSDLYVTFSL